MSDESDSADARILDGRSWAAFCDGLKAAGDVVLREATPLDPFERAEGFRYLSRLTRVALETFLECADPVHPVFRRPAHETVKIGADNPDNAYLSATIDGRRRYRIHGTRGTVHYLGLGTYVGHYGRSGRRGQSGYVEAGALEIGADGRFELTVSSEAPERGNWLPMEPDSDLLIVRQTFEDRAREAVAQLSIECLDADGPPAPLSAAFVDQGLASAAGYVHGTASLFTDWSEGFARAKNTLPRFDPARAAAAHGDPNIAYYHGYFEIAEDEALLVEVTPPACDYWNFQVNNHWMESLDYRYHRIDVNHAGARHSKDGSVRIVLAHETLADASGNWLELAGHRRGTMCLRWIGADAHPDPAVRLVKLEALRGQGAG